MFISRWTVDYRRHKDSNYHDTDLPCECRTHLIPVLLRSERQSTYSAIISTALRAELRVLERKTSTVARVPMMALALQNSVPRWLTKKKASFLFLCHHTDMSYCCCKLTCSDILIITSAVLRGCGHLSSPFGLSDIHPYVAGLGLRRGWHLPQR